MPDELVKAKASGFAKLANVLTRTVAPYSFETRQGD